MHHLPDSPRRLMQTRRITCEGYQREDGLYDIEAVLVDAKPFSVIVGDRKQIGPGEHFHEMRLRLVVDVALEIRDARVETAHAPYNACSEINPAYRSLVGLRLGPGFLREVRERLGGEQGCTHVNELLIPAVTTAMQTVWHVRDQLTEPPAVRRAAVGRPPELGQCHALRMDGEAVRKHYPAFSTRLTNDRSQ